MRKGLAAELLTLLKLDGSRAMLDNLDMGTKAISNVGMISYQSSGLPIAYLRLQPNANLWIVDTSNAFTVPLVVYQVYTDQMVARGASLIFSTRAGYVGDTFAFRDWTGAAWFNEVVIGYPRGVSFTPRAAPANPVEGSFYYDSVTQKLMVYNGAAWETVNSA